MSDNSISLTTILRFAIAPLMLSCVLIAPANAQTPPKVVRKTAAELLKDVKEWYEPEYPPIARQARAGGPVEVDLTIDEEGNVVSARVVSGHPLLRSAMLKAVRTWKFKPMAENNIPVRVTSRVSYTFPLTEPTIDDKTISELKRQVHRKPKSANARYELGAAYFKSLRYPQAIVQLTEAIRIDPKHFEAHLKLGHAYARTHSYEKARTAYIGALILEPESSEALHALGLIHMGLRQYEEAISTFDKSLRVEGPIISSYFLIGKCYVLLDRPAEAVGFYKQGLAKYPESDAGHYGLGEAYLMLTQYEDAINEFKESLKLSDGQGASLTRYHLGMAYLGSGDRESALREYEILKKLNEELASRLLEAIKRSPKDPGSKRVGCC